MEHFRKVSWKAGDFHNSHLEEHLGRVLGILGAKATWLLWKETIRPGSSFRVLWRLWMPVHQGRLMNLFKLKQERLWQIFTPMAVKKKKKDIMNVLPLPERTGPEREWKRETGGTTLHTEYKLVFSRALTRIQCLVVWSNTSQDMAVKIFLQRWLTFKSIDFEKSRFLFTTWMGLIQSVEGLKNKDGFPEEKAILSPYCKAESSSADFRFKTAASTSFLNLWLPYRFQACEPLQPRELFP